MSRSLQGWDDRGGGLQVRAESAFTAAAVRYPARTMHKRDNCVENPVVARQMRRFFNALSPQERKDPGEVAKAYGTHLFHKSRRRLVQEKKFTRSQFHVGIGISSKDFRRITKRAALVSDTLLLSHRRQGNSHMIMRDWRWNQAGYDPTAGSHISVATKEHLCMYCPDLEALGRWILDAEPLLRAGLVWYLPSYSIACNMTTEIPSESIYPTGLNSDLDDEDVPDILDFMEAGRTVVAQSETNPIQSDVVRPIFEMNLPYIDGVSMRDFGKITVQEFTSYAAFRSFLRQEFLSLDDALNSVQSKRELTKIGERIGDGVRDMESKMTAARRKRAVGVTGAVIGTVGATLVAVYGSAFRVAATIAGAGGGGGGIWGAVQAREETRPTLVENNKWYYVWVLSEASKRHNL